jgi:septal ring factor EnvC (AmiA/AmiB activator)
MKNIFLIAAITLLISACNQERDNLRVELAGANRNIDSLNKIANERESTINEFITSFNEVESNLDSVAVKQKIISLNTDKHTELKPDQKDRINSEIMAINNLMTENRKKIAELNRRLRSSTSKNAEFEKTIAILNEKLAQKEEELTTLNEKLNASDAQVAQLKTSVDTLTVHNFATSKSLSEKIAALHTAYYVIGKSKDLEVSKIIDRQGGLLGIGKTAKLNENVDKNKFTQIDYTQVGTIPINADNVKIVTSHPSDSYTLEGDEKNKNKTKNLMITNPEKFWSASKYLVIVKG